MGFEPLGCSRHGPRIRQGRAPALPPRPADRAEPFKPMKVLFLSSEVVPFSKTGGLADVCGALPRALRALGHDVAVLTPAYRQAKSAGPALAETGWTISVPIGGQAVEGRVLASNLPDTDVPVYLIDQPSYYDRDELYGRNGHDYPDNCARFLFFQRAALEAARLLDLQPDVIHCNDWQTGLVPVYLREVYRTQPGLSLRSAGTVMTIHNMAYQGAFPSEAMGLTGLDPSLFSVDRLEAYGHLNFLKAGLVDADLITTVSPTYAREIQTPDFGRGLDGLLRARSADLIGIVNGIDPKVWSPKHDPHLLANYDLESWQEGKRICKGQLQRRADLPERPEVPLLAAIGRLDPQKGWDLLVAIGHELLRRDLQLVVLGTGNERYEDDLDRLVDSHPGKIRAFFEFSNPLAHQIEAGADAFLMPSLYEPCGLNQLYSLAYGTVPIVRATGGLADTVVDANESHLANGTANGFSFLDPTPEALLATIDRAVTVWRDRATWDTLVRTGMSADWSWVRSAERYVAVYEDVRRRASHRSTP